MLKEVPKGLADPEFVQQHKMFAEMRANATILKEAAKGLADPELVQQYKVLEMIAPTLADLRKNSLAIAQISPTYLRSINQATEMFKLVDMATLSKSAGFARELIPAAVAAQKFLTNLDEIEPPVVEKTFKALSTQAPDDEIILPPESSKETFDLISRFKEIIYI